MKGLAVIVFIMFTLVQSGFCASATSLPASNISQVSAGDNAGLTESGSDSSGLPSEQSLFLPRFIVGIVELLLSIIIGVFVVFLAFKIFLMITKNIDDELELKKNNTAVGIIFGAFVFGVIILIKRSLYPIFSLIKDLIVVPQITLMGGVVTILYCIGYLLICISIAILIGILSLKLFSSLTKKIDEMSEIKANNTAIAIFYAGIYIALCFFIEEGLHALLVTLIPGTAINIL